MTTKQNICDILTSEILAKIIVDALFRAGIVQKKDVEEANAVVEDEIDVRHLSGELKYL